MTDQEILNAFVKQGLMTREQTASWLKVTVRTLHNLRSSGLVPITIGSSPRYDPIDVLNYIRNLKEQRDGQPATHQEQSAT